MSTVSSSLLDLILDLLSNDDELKRFEADPEKFVAEAGYEGCEDDVKDAVKMAGDMRSHSYGAEKAAPAARAEHTDYQAVSHVAPAHAQHYGPRHDDDDEPSRVEHVTHNNHVDNVTTHHYSSTTNHVDNSHWGDSYGDIEADGDVVLPGGFHAGEDNEYEGDFDVETSANKVFNTGDGAQVAGRDANAEDEAFSGSNNTNGSGVQVNGPADVDGDINNNHADDGSIAGNDNEIDNSTEIDASKSDDDVITITTSDDDTTTIIEDNVAQFGLNNVNDSENTANQSDAVAQDVGEVEADGAVVITDPELNVTPAIGIPVE